MTNARALLIIDVQRDFCEGGALAVPDGDAVCTVANHLMTIIPNTILTQDWHPQDHSSFASQHPPRAPFDTIELDYGTQTLWPDHCVRGTMGAEFLSGLRTDWAQAVIRKGTSRAIDSYSAFFENDHTTSTGLGGMLRERRIEEVILVGLATDFCVAWSALDARRLGFAVTVVLEGCRAIDLDGSLDRALAAMTEAGVRFATSADLVTRA